jgi:hypothetical protein
MALSSYTGTFDLNASTGDQSVTGVGFQPKFGIFWTTDQNATGSTGTATFGLGVAGSSTDRGYVAYRSETTVGTSNTAAGNNITRLLKLYSLATTPTVDVEVDFVSWDSDGFTVNISNAPSSTRRVHYLVWGGTDITDVNVVDWTVTNTATQAITGVGFESDLIIFLGWYRD